MAKNGFRVFDSDMHIMEPPDLWERYIAPQFQSIAPRGVTSENVRDLRINFPDEKLDLTRFRRPPRHGHNYERNQALYRDDAARGWNGEAQLEAMNVEGVDVAVMFPSRGLNVLVGPNGGSRVSDPRFAAAIARAYNDWLYEFCQADPQRMLGAGMISVYNVNDAVEETQRVVEDLGFKAVFLRSNIINGKPWHDPYYEPLWNTLERLRIPLGLHQATASSIPQLCKPWFGSPSGLQRAYGQPIGQMFGVGSFVGGGILERHPTLRVAFLEANCSWLPWLLWRLDEAYELEGDLDMRELTMAPSEYFKRQCVASVEPDETPARYTIDFLGNDNLVYSTDYPTAIPAIRTRRRASSNCRYRTTTNGRSCGTTARVFMRSAEHPGSEPAEPTRQIQAQMRFDREDSLVMETTTQNALERFISKTRELFAREPDLDKRWLALRPILAELLADPEVREASKEWPVPSSVPGSGEHRGGNLLFYEDPDYGFVVNGQIHTEGRRQPEPKHAHDHGRIYTAYGLLDGHERIVQYERIDDGSRPEYAEVRKTADYVAAPGDIHLARPRDIHVEVNVGERTAAVIIRSARDGVPSNLHGRYDLETNSYHESIGPRQIPAEMLPKKRP